MAGEGDGFRRIINNDIDAGNLFKGADIAALAADDAALELFTGQIDGRDGQFSDIIAGNTLNREADDLAGVALGLIVGLQFKFADAAGGFIAGIAFDLSEDQRAGIIT